MIINYQDRITYRYYEINPPVLVIYNFSNDATYYYDSVSAEILYAILLDKNEKIAAILDANSISDDVYQTFIEETEGLLNSSLRFNNEPSDYINEITDNEELISKIQNDLYKQNVMFKFHIDITGKCNCRCVHCYHTFDSYKQDLLNVNNIDELFEKLYSLGVFIITISGGEPFLKKDLLDIIKKREKYGFVFQILTNGYLLDENIISKISTCNINKLSFSYYGSENSNSLITGHSDFRDKLLKVVDLCIKYKVKYELKFILLKINIDDFDDYVELCKKLGIRILFEPCLIPKIDGDNSNFEYKLDFDTYKKFMVNHIGFFYDGTDMTLYNNKCINCSAGRYGLYCDHEGDIYPCVSYRDYLGKCTEIIDIWNNSNKLRMLRERRFNQFTTFNKFSFCKYCYQICPGLSFLRKRKFFGVLQFGVSCS